MLDSIDTWFWLFCGVVGFVVLVWPDRSVRILSYGKRGAADVHPRLLGFTRAASALVFVGSVVELVTKIFRG
jgi:hypothetical protein